MIINFRLLVSFNFPKILMVLLICVTFVGQAMASTIMSYHMMSMTGMSAQEKSHDMSKMDHSSHHMASDSTSEESEESEENCCVKTCSCFTGGCTTAVALIEDVSNDPIINSSSKINSISSLAQSQQLTSLYRPPILS